MSAGIPSGNIAEGVAAYQKWLKESGLEELTNKRNSLRDELDKLRKSAEEARANEALEAERIAIEKSGLSESDYFRKKAVKEFGYTPYFYDAGYIVANGKMLNFSGEKGRHFGSRGQDHRAIGTIYAETDGTAALNRFVNDGNIRIVPESPGFDVSATIEPTKEQYATIRKFIYEYANKGYFSVDISDKDGRVVGSLQYENRINPTRIIADLKHYYATGEVRQPSSLEGFHYSLSEDTEGRQLSPATAKRFSNSKAVDENGNLLVLYHGTASGEFSIFDKSKGNVEGDFGSGFYMGTNTLQPLTLVCNEDKPKFYTVELDMTGLKVLTVEIGMDWAMLIAYYRKEMESAKGTPIYEKYAHMADGYDVIIGYIANDRMYTELSRFFNKTLTDVALINCLSALDLGKQYVAISEKACKQIKILKEEPLSQLELSLLKDMSAERRKEGIALAEEIEVKYRREGKFFDEILKGE